MEPRAVGWSLRTEYRFQAGIKVDVSHAGVQAGEHDPVGIRLRFGIQEFGKYCQRLAVGGRCGLNGERVGRVRSRYEFGFATVGGDSPHAVRDLLGVVQPAPSGEHPQKLPKSPEVSGTGSEPSGFARQSRLPLLSPWTIQFKAIQRSLSHDTGALIQAAGSLRMVTARVPSVLPDPGDRHAR